MGAFKNLAAQFDPVDMNRKGDQFEIVCKWFLENYPTYKATLRRVWRWKDWPDRWSDVEAGIDLVAEDHEGRLWAIQAKAYTHSISKEQLNKFLAEASRTMFSYRIVIATTDKLHHIAQRTMEDLHVGFLGLADLEDFPDWPESLTDLSPAKPQDPKTPWDYQLPAINDVVKGFKTADRGQLIMACGTGKTLTAWFIRERLAAQRTLVLVPSLSLLKQTMKEWRTANMNKPFQTLPVCSDDSVRDSDGVDSAVSHITYLGEPADTDPAAIAAFLSKPSGPRVVFATYHSSRKIEAALKLDGVPDFDLVIADEAHRLAGAASPDFATVLKPSAIKAKCRLFMTATPRILAASGTKSAKNADEYASMDDPAKFGEVFHRLTFNDAIEQNLLTDYQVAVIGVNEATVMAMVEHRELVTLDGKKSNDAASVAAQIAVLKAMRQFDLRRMITFHGRVNGAKTFAKSLPDVAEWVPSDLRPTGSIWAKHASGEMSAGQRHILLQHLRHLDGGERGLLANARCLAEGVDVPALDGVAFIDPRRSEVDIVQAVGRAIRKSESKTIGTIVIPVFVDANEDPGKALNNDRVFKPVWDVIKALRAHDAELGRQLDEMRRQLGRRRGAVRLPAKIHTEDLSSSIGEDFARAFELRLIERVTLEWEFAYGLLERFVDEYGHGRVPHNYRTETDYNLGGWVITQRQWRANGRLRAEREARLNKIEGWSWDAKTDQWESSFQRLLEFVAEFGSSQVPYPHRTSDGFRLGHFVKGLRTQYSQGKLPEDRVRRLEQLPDWIWSTRDEQWEKRGSPDPSVGRFLP